MGSALLLCPTPDFNVPGAVVGLDVADLVCREEAEEDGSFSLLPDFTATLLAPLLVAGRVPLVGGVFVGMAVFAGMALVGELVETPTGFVFNGRNPLVDFPRCSDAGADNTK